VEAVRVRAKSLGNASPWLFGGILLGGAPRGAVFPVRQSIRRPRCRFVCMADIAGVRNFQAIGLRRIDEMEGVAADVHVGNRLFDLRHIAGDTLAAGATRGMVGMLFDRRGMRAILRVRPVTSEACATGRLPQHGIILRAVRVMATEAGDAARIHQAGYEVVPCMRFLCAVPSAKWVKVVSPSL
jgi:hypothetical protein